MKNKYSLLNKIDIDTSQYVIEEVSEFEKKKMMEKFISSKNKKVFLDRKKILAAAALLVIVNVGLYGDNVLAAVTSFKYSINAWLGINNSKENYSTEIGKTLEGNDTKITLNEFFTDNSRIIINFNINKENNELIDITDKLVPDIYINDKKIERSSDYVGYSIRRYKDIVGYDNVKNSEIDTDSNVIIEVEMKDLPLNDKEDVTLVFSNLAREYGVDDSDFTYNFVYDSTSYKNDTKVVKVDKNIIIDNDELYVEEITIRPDRVLISGSSKGFSAFESHEDADYYYDIVDENGDSVPLKEEIGKGAYYYRRKGNELPLIDREINTLKIIPYTFNKIDTNATSVLGDGRIKYIIEDKIITVNLK